MTDQTVPPTIDLTKYIETRFFGDRPHIRNHRIPVATVAYNFHKHAWSIAETADNFGLNEAQVLAALLYYAEYQAEIDAQEQTEAALFDETYREYGSR